MGNFCYTEKQRFLLIALSLFGFFGVNGAFLYSIFGDPELLVQALLNPISAAFIIEALVLVPVIGYFLRVWKVTKMSLSLFIGLSLIGSLAFSLPIAILNRPQAKQ